MEELWKAMTANPEEIETPEWHLKVLEERERALANGETEFVDWEDAKKEIRRRTTERNK